MNNQTGILVRFLLLLLSGSLLLGLTGCTGAAETDYLADSTHQLAISNHSYNSEKWIRNYRQLQLDDPGRRLEYELSIGMEHIRAGSTETAIDLLVSLQTVLLEEDKSYQSELLAACNRYLALAYLRLGEQQNCIHHHQQASCIIPLDPSAIHQQTAGSRGAVEQYSAMLADDPDDFESRYLLNLAHMTLGEYPEVVSSDHLIPHGLLKHPGSWLVRDIAMQKGLAVSGLAGGVIADDMNGDGTIDLVISSWDMNSTLQYFENDGAGNWQERSQISGLDQIPGGLNLLQTDYNNDGLLDIFVLRGGWLGRYGHLPNTLLRNNGAGSNGQIAFTDVTQEMGLDAAFPTQTAVWADFNNDGRLDVYIGNESAVTGIHNPSELYLNRPGDTFLECARPAGVQLTEASSREQHIVKGVAAADYDRDGWIDLYISTRGARNFLFRNQGAGPDGVPTFLDVTESTGLGGDHRTFTCWFWDYDNDGYPDILAAGFHSPEFYNGRSISYDFGRELLGLEHEAQTGLLFRNQGDGTFQEVTAEVGLDKILYMMGGNFGDIDNDGRLDFYAGTGDPDLRSVIPNRMFRFDGAIFQEITNQGFGHIQKGHGAAFADFDGDGDQDIYMVIGGFYPGDVYQNMLLDNLGEGSNNFIRVSIQGKKSNSFGVGSELMLSITDGQQKRRIYRTVSSGGSFGAASFSQHIGIGQATQVDTLKIRWSGSGTVQVLTDLTINQSYRFTEE